MRDSCFLVWGLVGNSLGKKYVFVRPTTILSFDLAPPTHTTHTYTHKYGASFSVTLGVVTSAEVCVCSCRGRSQTIRRVCSLSLRVFDIQITIIRGYALSVFSVVICLCLRQYAPPKHSSNVILVLSFALCHCPCVTCPT